MPQLCDRLQGTNGPSAITLVGTRDGGNSYHSASRKGADFLYS